MPSWEFPCSEPIDASIAIAAGTIAITAAPTDVVTVIARRSPGGSSRFSDENLDSELTVTFGNGRLDITEVHKRTLGWRNTQVHLEIGVPAASRCAVRAAAADVTCHGDPGALDIETAAGSVEAGTVRGPAEIITISGSIRVGEITDKAALNTASGRLRLRRAGGDVSAKSVSGDIQVGTADRSVTARTASGRVSIGSVTQGRTDVNTVSGDIEVGVAPGTGLFLDLSSMSGRVTSDLEPSGAKEGQHSQAGQEGQHNQADLQVHCRSLSGAVHVARAAAAEMAG